MQRLVSTLLVLLLCCCISRSQANRVYVHPFNLFAVENVSCATPHTQTSKPRETHPVAPLDIQVLTSDSRDPSNHSTQRQNVTEKMVVLTTLFNSLGLRLYQALSSKQSGTNTLLSPINAYGSLVTFSMGASKNTTDLFQFFLGLTSSNKPDDCASLVGRHNVLKTLKSINSLVDDGTKDRVTTHVWAFPRQDTQLSEDFIQGAKDFSDTSFIRGVDFSKPDEAEQLVNNFVEKTSNGKVKSIFKDLNSSSDLLFMSSFSFRGSWGTPFKPDETSLQEFHVDETTTVMAPLMTHTGHYHYLNDKMQRCTVVKLPLSKQSYMLLVLPHEGASLQDVEAKLLTYMSGWQHRLQAGLLELSLPKFSMSSVIDLRDLLTYLNPEIEAQLLGSQAEFNQLSNSKPFTIDKAVNKVLFEMSEEGAEPQDNKQEADMPLKLSINRPFFFAVLEGDLNAILLLGKITNPTL
ncbi:angiotensinogen [Anabas testudineus]|nr:angiotensinogen [Anabas testudineus]